LAIVSCGYSSFQEAEPISERVKDLLLLAAPSRDLGIEFPARGAIPDVAIYPGGRFEIVDPGAPMPVPLKAAQLDEFVSAAMQNRSVMTPNQRVAAELLNDSFFNMPPEARFLLRVAAVEALCPQAKQTEAFRALVNRMLTSIPPDAPSHDPESQIRQTLERIAKRETIRRAYMSKIRQLLGNEQATLFDEMYSLRSSFLHDGHGRGRLGEAAVTVFELCRNLLPADIQRQANLGLPVPGLV
jgi:hypothetical protein